MLPMPHDWFTYSWWVLVMAYFLFGPFVFCYVVWRFLADVRAVRRAVERLASAHQTGRGIAPESQAAPEGRPPQRISLSQFAR